VTTLKSFPYLAFPHFLAIEKTRKQLSFDGELMASFGPRLRNLPASPVLARRRFGLSFGQR